MAQRTIDDMDEVSPAESQHIIWNGYQLYIDLGEANRDKLAEVLAPYFKAGRIGKGVCPHPALAGPTNLTVTHLPEVAADNAAIREWWGKQPESAGLGEPNGAGRIPGLVRDAFNAAHQPT